MKILLGLTSLLGLVYYSKLYGTPEMAQVFCDMYKEYVKMCERSGVDIKHYWIERKFRYVQNGRFSTEQEAIEIDRDLYKFLLEQGVKMHNYDANSFLPPSQ